MGDLRQIATTAILLGFPLAFTSGCGGAASAPVTPASSATQSVQSGTAHVANRRHDAKAGEWPQFGYNPGHSGYNRFEDTITTQNVSNLQVAWNDSSLIQPGGIVLSDGVAYVDDMGQANEGLYALDAATGAQKWYANLNLNGSWGNMTHAVPVVAGNVVVSPCSNGSSSPFLTGLCGVNARSGQLLWTYYCTQYQGGGCSGLVNGSSPALYQRLVYAQITQGINEQPDTEALNPKTGAVVWDVPGVFHCPDGGASQGTPLPASNGLVFAVLACQGSSGATEICALSAASGSAAWCESTSNIYVETLIAGGGKLFAAETIGSNTDVIAFDATSGSQVWTATLPGANSATLAMANNRLFVDDGGVGIFALNAHNGKPVWSYTANSNLTQGGVLSVANGIVYADGGGGNNGNVALAAFDETTGSVIWTSSSVGNGAAPATPVILDGTVYAGCYTMCAFALSSSGEHRKR
ncbi:MAG TPA: PQQ-binding-like beta-propeller repeat protein [Candidatus Cybelea sp.]|jgi:outer membrane protein assembly factor BamB|nr:PQQ-binding-like beta-propeller repeat protein [Candidatus Cybelea sp.]